MRKLFWAVLLVQALCGAVWAGMKKIGEFNTLFVHDKSTVETSVEVSVDDERNIVFVNDEYEMEYVVKRDDQKDLVRLFNDGIEAVGQAMDLNMKSSDQPVYAKGLGNANTAIHFYTLIGSDEAKTFPVLLLLFKQGEDRFMYKLTDATFFDVLRKLMSIVPSDTSQRRELPRSASNPSNLPTDKQPRVPEIDRGSSHAQGYNNTDTRNPVYDAPSSGRTVASLQQNKRVDLLASMTFEGDLYYKVQFIENNHTVTGWTKAQWMTVLPTGRNIPDETSSAPAIDWNSPYAQGYSRAADPLLLYETPRGEKVASLQQNERVDILVKAMLNGTLYYKVQFIRSTRLITGWTVAQWLTVLPTGREIPDDTPAQPAENPPSQQQKEEQKSSPPEQPKEPVMQNRWDMTDAEHREFLKNSEFAKSAKKLSCVMEVVRATLQAHGPLHYQEILQEQKSWISNKAKELHEFDGALDKKESFRLAMVARAGELLSRIFVSPPTRTERYEWADGNDAQTLIVKWLGAVGDVNIISASLVLAMNGHAGEFEGMGIIASNGTGFICDKEYAGSMTLKIQGSTATVGEFDHEMGYHGAAAVFVSEPMRVLQQLPKQKQELQLLTGDRPLTRSGARKGYVTARGLNIRAEPNTNSRVIAQAKQGASLSLVETYIDFSNAETSQYPWYKIDDLEECGWVYGKYVTVSDAPLTGTVTLKSGYLNVRSNHSKTALAVGRVEKNWRFDVVEAWASDDEPYPWYRIVDSNGNGGWVSGRYFVVDGHQPNDGWHLTDVDYREFTQYSDFALADETMNEVWSSIQVNITGTRYQKLLDGQKAWISKRRDRMATNIYNKQGGTKRECYRLATLERVKEIKGALKKAGVY